MKLHRGIIAVGALLVATLATVVQAATFVGSSADITDFAGGSEVSTNGTLIDAVNLLNHNVGGVGVGTTINGVLFKGTQPGQFHEGAESFANASFVYHGGSDYADSGLWTSGGAYDTLADSQLFNIDNGNISYGDGYGVINLAPGQLYELQVFMLDDRGSQNKTFPIEVHQATFTGSADNTSNVDPNSIGYISGITIGGNGSTQANGEIATILFSIDAGYNGIFVNSWDGGSYSGMQLRQIPEPTSLTLLGVALAGLTMGAARRTRKRS